MILKKWHKHIAMLCIIGLILPMFYPVLSVKANDILSEPVERVYVNQSGYNLGQPKRFTAPLSSDGAEFSVKDVDTSTVVYKGTVDGQIGDFTDFEPTKVGEYIIEVEGEQSVPFSVGPYWLEKVSYKPALDFMIDSRSYVGTHPSNILGIGWRDGHQFSFEVNMLVQWYLSNPSALTNMER